MSQSRVETCQIRLAPVADGPRALGIAKAVFSALVDPGHAQFRWVVEVLTGAGSKKIDESEKFELSLKSEHEGYMLEDGAIIDTQARLIRQRLLQRLQSDGWEFVTSDPADRVITLKKGKTQVPSNSDFTDLLKQLASLRDAGIITPSEFEQKKAEILKRL
jgi:hypothetical protein